MVSTESSSHHLKCKLAEPLVQALQDCAVPPDRLMCEAAYNRLLQGDGTTCLPIENNRGTELCWAW